MGRGELEQVLGRALFFGNRWKMRSFGWKMGRKIAKWQFPIGNLLPDGNASRALAAEFVVFRVSSVARLEPNQGWKNIPAGIIEEATRKNMRLVPTLVLVSSLLVATSVSAGENGNLANPNRGAPSPVTAARDEGAGMSLSLVGGLPLTTVTETAATQAVMSYALGAGYAFGGLVEISHVLNPRLNFESGLIYSHKKLSANWVGSPGTPSSVDGTLNYLQIPVVARYSFLPSLGAGAGVYYGRGIGMLHSSLAGADRSFTDSHMSQNDFGLVLNARGTIPIATQISGFLDSRYLFGLVDLDTHGTPDNTEYLREMQFLAGISLSL